MLDKTRHPRMLHVLQELLPSFRYCTDSYHITSHTLLLCFNHIPSWSMLHVLQELLPSFRYCTDLSTHPLDVLFKHIPSWAISFTYPLELSHPHSLLSYRIRALSHLRDLSLEPLNHLLLPLTTHHVILSTYPPTLLSLAGWDMVTKKCIGLPPLSPGNPFLSNLFYVLPTVTVGWCCIMTPTI